MALGAGDCERLHDGLIAQPVNTASALAYLAVGAWLAGRGRPGFGLAVAAAGVGSVDYHGPGSPAARLLHDGTLYAVVGFVAWNEVAVDDRLVVGGALERRRCLVRPDHSLLRHQPSTRSIAAPSARRRSSMRS